VGDHIENHSSPAGTEQARLDVELAHFLLTNPGAKLAAASLKPGAEAGITFTNLDGEWRIYAAEGGRVSFEPGKATDPDFELRIAPHAVNSIRERHEADVGDLGVAFFEHIIAREQDRKIHVTLHSGLLKLTRRGWLGVLARGGPKVVMWMAAKGLRGPGAIATALGRIKK
jgi:hypothetical protein